MNGSTEFLAGRTMTNRVMIMAGGTGGHIFPALAIANKLRSQGVEILWLGTRGRLEEVLVPKNHYDIAYIDVKGIRRNGFWRKLGSPFMILRALFESFGIIKKFKPDVVIGMGGYASGPGGLAAYLMGINVVLHEQNAAAGMTNRLLSKVASRILLGFPGAFSGPKVSVVGNPVRDEIVALNNTKKIDVNKKKFNILIVGGSLGAQALNEIVPKALMHFNGTGADVEVVHQCGKDNSEKTRVLYEGAEFKVNVTDFIDNMQQAYLDADLIICRAGALTVCEVAAALVPAIFVPLPSAVDDHQSKNAQTLVDHHAGVKILQKDLNDQDLYNRILEFYKDRSKLVEIQKNLKEIAITDASDKVVDVLRSYFKS